MKVVICGGGVIGASVAFYLARRGQDCTVVERCHLACSSSGKAGGVIVRGDVDFRDADKGLAFLSLKSFHLHQELAQLFPNIGYRPVEIFTTTAQDPQHDGDRVGWVNKNVHTEKTCEGSNALQVHPFQLTNALMTASSQLAGSTLKIGTVQDIIIQEGKVRGVRVDDSILPADVVVIAMGPWTLDTANWFPGWKPEIISKQGNSVILKTSTPVDNHMLAASYQDCYGEIQHLYVIPRPDGYIYACGGGDNVPLPDDPRNVIPKTQSCEIIHKSAGTLSKIVANAQLLVKQSCFAPSTPDGLPSIGKIPHYRGAYVASGHNSGITHAPATALALAELIMTGKSAEIDLSPFDPGRFQ